MFKFFNDPRENSTILKCNELEKSVTADSFESAKMPQHALIEVLYSSLIFESKKLLNQLRLLLFQSGIQTHLHQIYCKIYKNKPWQTLKQNK